jgi:hypothetical protein
MRRKIANAVEGSRYNFLNVIPGSFSRYSKEARLDTAEAIFKAALDGVGKDNGKTVSSKLKLQHCPPSSSSLKDQGWLVAWSKYRGNRELGPPQISWRVEVGLRLKSRSSCLKIQ